MCFWQCLSLVPQRKYNASFSLGHFATLETPCFTLLCNRMCMPAAMTSIISAKFVISFNLRFGTPLREGGAVLVFVKELELRAGGCALDR